MHDKSSGGVRCVQFLHWFFMTMFMEVLDNKSNKRRKARFGRCAQGLRSRLWIVRGSTVRGARAKILVYVCVYIYRARFCYVDSMLGFFVVLEVFELLLMVLGVENAVWSNSDLSKTNYSKPL